MLPLIETETHIISNNKKKNIGIRFAKKNRLDYKIVGTIVREIDEESEQKFEAVLQIRILEQKGFGNVGSPRRNI
jgi:hypothetical protein